MKKILKYNRNLFMWLIVITIYIYICWKLIIDVNETSIYFNLAENSKDTFNIKDFEEIEKIEERERDLLERERDLLEREKVLDENRKTLCFIIIMLIIKALRGD